MFKKLVRCISLIGLFLLVACDGNANETEPTIVPVTATEVVAELEVTATPEPSPTATATATATVTPEPTATPTTEPTDTPEPTATRAPVTPTRPRPTPVPTRENRDETTPEAGDVAAYPDGNDLIARAQSNTNALDSVRIKQVLVVEMGETGQLNMDITCDIISLDFYCRMETTADLGITEPVTQLVEIVRLNDQTWMRQDNSDWLELSPEQSATISAEGIVSPPMNSATYEAEVTGETSLSGHSVYEVTLTFDAESVRDVLESQNTMLPAGTELEVVDTASTIWISQEEQWLYRQDISLDYMVEGQLFNMTTQLSYTSHNQPLEIPDPTNE